MAFSGEQRILALDVHPRSFGFVILEAPEKILDWGVRSFRSGTNAVHVSERPKLASLLRHYAPRVIVVTRPPRRECGRMLTLIREEASLRRTTTHTLTTDAVQRAFPECATRYEIAAAIALRLPELCNILPPKRKPWKSEHYDMSIFDAAALGLAYFRNGQRKPPTALTATPSDLSNGPWG
jgi:hypothetical protein